MLARKWKVMVLIVEQLKPQVLLLIQDIFQEMIDNYTINSQHIIRQAGHKYPKSMDRLCVFVSFMFSSPFIFPLSYSKMS